MFRMLLSCSSASVASSARCPNEINLEHQRVRCLQSSVSVPRWVLKYGRWHLMSDCFQHWIAGWIKKGSLLVNNWSPRLTFLKISYKGVAHLGGVFWWRMKELRQVWCFVLSAGADFNFDPQVENSCNSEPERRRGTNPQEPKTLPLVHLHDGAINPRTLIVVVCSGRWVHVWPACRCVWALSFTQTGFSSLFVLLSDGAVHVEQESSAVLQEVRSGSRFTGPRSSSSLTLLRAAVEGRSRLRDQFSHSEQIFQDWREEMRETPKQLINGTKNYRCLACVSAVR